MLSDPTLGYAEDLIRALLGMDALSRAESDSSEGLVALNMSTAHRPERFDSFEEATERFLHLRTAASRLPEPDRQRYYRQVCDSTITFAHWRQAGLAFTEQMPGLLHLVALPADDEELDSLRTEMKTLLTELGYSGDLEAQCAAWEARHTVPVKEIPGVLDELLDTAWDRTSEHLDIPAPKLDGMRFTTVSNAPFNARCDYLSRTVEINIDPVLTRPALKYLVLHECCPGHYLQFKLRETWYHEGRAAADGLLSLVNSASSTVFEGIADTGIHMLDWFESGDDRLWNLINRYRAGIGTVAAWKVHAMEDDENQVADWLRQQALVGGDGWVASRMAFITDPSRSALIWSCWKGGATVAPLWEHTPPDRRPELLTHLYGRLHSPQSLRLFS